MRALVMAVGEEAIFAEAGLTAAPAPAGFTPEAKSAIGLISLEYRRRHAFGVGLPFGRIEADALHALADISERYGDGSLRTTPWRAVLLTGITPSDAAGLAEEVKRLDLITDATDPRLNIFACVGAPSCNERKQSMRVAMPPALPPSSARPAARRCMSPAAANPAPIAVRRRSPSSAATGAMISSATAAPPTGQA